MVTVLKKISRLFRRTHEKMAKRAKKRGHSARNGNRPSPYCKYKKVPYKYTFPGAGEKMVSPIAAELAAKAKRGNGEQRTNVR